MNTETLTASVIRLRARILYLAARLRFARGINQARFDRSDLSAMLEMDIGSDSENDSKLREILQLIPQECNPVWNGAELIITDPSGFSKNGADNAVAEVLDYWRKRTGRTARTVYTSTRISVVRARLKEGYTVTQLKYAVDSMMKSNFHTENGYTDAEHAFKTERLERWLASKQTETDSVSEIERITMETIRRRNK